MRSWIRWLRRRGEFLVSFLFSCPLSWGSEANESSILCSDFAIKRIDEPFTGREDDPGEWAL